MRDVYTDASIAIDARLVREIGLSAHRVTTAAGVFFAAANVAFAWLLVRARLAPRLLALLGGYAALFARKGGTLYRLAGTFFVWPPASRTISALPIGARREVLPPTG